MVGLSSSFSVMDEICAASSLAARNQPRAARRKLESLVQNAPHSFEAWRALGCVLAKLNFYAEAGAAFEKALSINHHDARTHFHYALMCLKLAHAMRAHEHFRLALALDPLYVDAYKELACFLVDQHDFVGAKLLLKEGLKHLPLHPDLVYLLIRIKMDMGEREKSARLCMGAMHGHPHNTGLFSLYEELEQVLPYDPFSLQMQQFYTAMTSASLQRADLAFSLARVFERGGDNETAFQYYTAFHTDFRVLEPYDEKSTRRFFEENAALAALPLPEPSEAERFTHPTPIFIVGMPRSATTLVEQMLDCHPMIQGAGELMVMSNLVHTHLCAGTDATYPNAVATTDRNNPEKYQQLAALYHREIARLSNGAAYVCDKMPNNFLYLSLIVRMFPNARIIHCRRDPVDTCVSIYTNHFGGHHPYAHDLKTLGRYYRRYEAFMNQWEKQHPERLFTLHYESLINDTEATLRRLLEYVGVPWDAACLEFHTNPRVVRTVSQQQVRTPIFSSPQKHSARYAPYLTPLKEALGDLVN